MNHLEIKEHQSVWKEEYNSLCKETSVEHSAFDKYKIKCSQAAKTYFGWIELIVHNNLPFEFVNNPLAKKYSILEGVHAETIKSYMFQLQEYVKVMIQKNLPERFGLIIDGWSNGTSEHVVAVFATCGTSTGCFTVLLGINELCDRTNQTAQNHIDFIKKTLEKYNRTPDCVDFMVGDNTNLNPCIARNLCGDRSIPFIGCYSHKLNLALKTFQADIEPVLRKVEEVMILLRTNNMFGILKTVCEEEQVKLKRPVLRNVTRWSSTYTMITRYLELNRYLFHDRFRQVNLIQKLLTPIELEQLRNLVPILEELDDVTKALQNSSLTLVEARTYFDILYEKYGRMHECFRVYLRNYITSNFENAVVKVMSKSPLNEAEKVSMRNFVKKSSDVNNQTEATENGVDDVANLSTLEIAEMRLKRQRLNTNDNTEYIPLYHVSPTSNIVERLFSHAKLIYSERRRSMKLDTFEMILYLKANKQFWDVHAIDQIIAAKKSKLELEDFMNGEEEGIHDVIVLEDAITPDEFMMYD
jgi:hypothetical protein